MIKQEVQTMDKKEVTQRRDLAVEAAITQAEIREKAKYVLAYQRPRNEDRCEKRILDAVRLRSLPRCASTATQGQQGDLRRLHQTCYGGCPGFRELRH